MRMCRALQVVLVGGAMVVVAACGANGSESVGGRSSAATGISRTSLEAHDGVTVSGLAVPPTPRTGGPISVRPAPPGEPPAPPDRSGTVILRTVTLSGIAVPYVPVDLRLVRPCDPAGHDIAEGTPEVRRWDATTDANGQAVFAVPTGCFRFGMDPPAGTNPVPEGLHSLFVESPRQTVYGLLRFQDPAPDPVCAPQTIVHDLGVGPPLDRAPATVGECDGYWAVIAWDVPGDSQRIVRHGDGGWTTYVVFPHDRCWRTAESDGAPAVLRKYFQAC
ncbi:hypothetical protein [Nocardia mexicana]|uniref:Uncharacterized protein n=1 Tax=Nocardia mexicana TaxID=279262 RepID=A0A370GH19_9NOCA|nr:hypothetical protein [Nocardia mexicana]RDI42951.1 hypothetical protein DFR68_12385 [Nocardia mexicana]